MIGRVYLFAAVCLMGMFSASGADAFGRDDRWVSGWGQGLSEAAVTRGPGNRIYVSCDDDPNLSASTISFSLAGKQSTGSSITLTFDRADPQRFSLWPGGEVPSNCRACASNFDGILAGFRRHRSVHVMFENGDSTRFTLRQSSKALNGCVADFYQ